MRAALVAEYRKLVTTRLWWILLLVMVAYMALIAGVLAASMSLADGGAEGAEGALADPDAVVRTVYTVAVSLGYLFPVLAGAMAVTSEFRHKTITPTLLVEPRRTVVLLAKLGAGAVLGVLFGVLGTAACVGAGGVVLAATGQETFLGQGATWQVLARSVLALAVWAVLGVAFGVAVTNQVAVIVVVLAFTQFVEPIARLALASTDWGAGIARFLPGAAGEAISGGSVFTAAGAGGLLAWWQGLLVLLGYAAVLALLGRLTTLRRDVT